MEVCCWPASGSPIDIDLGGYGNGYGSDPTFDGGNLASRGDGELQFHNVVISLLT